MCSFLIYFIQHFKNINLQNANKLLQMRGPDGTNITELNGYKFIHNILHLCGEKTFQPIIENNICILFNGEIYNYKDFGDYKSDTLCLIDLYKKYDMDFVKKLDGEFAIVIFDFNKNCVILSSDIFATKPLYYVINNNKFIISSISKTINENFKIKNNLINKLPANSCIKILMNKTNIINKKITVYDFDLRQHKRNEGDFFRALEKSVLKRITHNNENNNKIFFTLSSGYDSGIISLILNKNNIKINSYTMPCLENIDILALRSEYTKKTENNTFIQLSKDDYLKSKDYITKNIDNLPVLNNKDQYYHCKDDWAAYGLHYIFQLAKKNNQKIYLSGHGPDEIYSDYGFNGKVFRGGKLLTDKKKYEKKMISTLFGKFPSDLKKIFPWNNFYNGLMKAFISKEEGVGSINGIESRYPYLDKMVVQEFLWLNVDNKNKFYKSPLHKYMIKNNYPFDNCKKRGFKAKRKLQKNNTLLTHGTKSNYLKYKIDIAQGKLNICNVK
jgi:asparagine synthetase B (glutamine-hydrolysing)